MPVTTKSDLSKPALYKLLEEYEIALDWLRSKGLNIDPSRLNKYKKHFITLVENWGSETVREVVENRNYAASIYEIYEIIEIRKKLEEVNSAQLDASLKKAISGYDLYSDEVGLKNSSSARNYSFELYMARYFKRAGYDLNFETLADFNAHDDLDSIFVECKRPQKEETFGKNIKEALKQSIKRFLEDESRNQKGIAAIDLTALINPNLEFFQVDDFKTISDNLKLAAESYSPEIKRIFDQYGRDCLSVILHWRIPVFHTKEQTIGLYNYCFSVPIFESGSNSEEVFQRYNRKLMETVGQ
jgi:hypothetical protein